RGKTGFAATPASGGRSALLAFTGGMRALDAFLESRTNPAFGRMTVNVAALRCGQSRGRHDGREVLGEDRNIIPDYAEGVIEVRTSPGVDLDACIVAFDRGVADAGGRLEVAMKRFDFRGYHVPPERLAPLADAIATVLGGPAEFDAFESHGYSDVQLLNDQLEVPCAMFGPTGGNYHAADEYVELESLTKVQAVLERLIEPYRAGAATAAAAERVHASAA
ncbi:MAG: M20/M25/M40 family metallo-hydrolase, partial [bacterium]|nr:M20/M25/M40 family metallo-hydrolase [bacterium]